MIEKNNKTLPRSVRQAFPHRPEICGGFLIEPTSQVKAQIARSAESTDSKDQTLRKLSCQAPENSKAQQVTLMLQALGAASPLHEALDVHNRFLASLQLS